MDDANFNQCQWMINGKLGNFGGGKSGQNSVTLGEEKGTKEILYSEIHFSKRYRKYSKKYLKKNNLRDWLMVVTSSPMSYGTSRLIARKLRRRGE
ncbi:hypothetical protein WA026_006229 [Henosepilachna vigintioctopunctata]|uniref:Large ribosomal subunit protein eL22 n=1 Tax=Henosepilachna vigintioctopunctata TaxID=420089 RepID=A0AAW1TPZ1_9CUCU